MLETKQLTLGSLLVWTGRIVGLGLIVGSLAGPDWLASFGLATLIITCAYSVRRSMAARDDALRCAFDLGREQGLSAVR